MKTIEQLRQHAATRRTENQVQAVAYSITLSWLAPANFVFVVGAALLSLIAGASILVDQSIISRTESGVLALISAALTIIHTKLDCERYQAECKKLLGLHRGISVDYANLDSIDDLAELRKQLLALDHQMSAITKLATALPFQRALVRARRNVGGG